MNEHDAIVELLALAAAGVLSPEEERRVREHAARCAECAAELNRWQALAGEIGAVPVPQAPARLVAQTQARVAAVLRSEADRRWDETVLLVLALLCWTVGLSVWAIWRLVTAGAAGLVAFELSQTLLYLTVSTLLAWLTGGVAAVIAGQRRRAVWRRL
jgi:anti-sigma factor RsiW